MKSLIKIAFVFSIAQVNAQEWRDSLEIARKAYQNEEYSKALKYYRSAQSKAPENVNLSDEMGQSAYKAREFETAEKIYQQSTTSKESGKKRADQMHNMGNARMKQKNYQGAIDAYKSSLRLNPTDDQTRYNLSEAIRKLKEQQKNEQKQNQQNQNQKKEPQSQKKQNNQANSQQNKQQQQIQESGNEKKEQSNSQLPDKTVERLLDKLSKQEAETKRKLTGNKSAGSSPESGKDW